MPLGIRFLAAAASESHRIGFEINAQHRRRCKLLNCTRTAARDYCARATYHSSGRHLPRGLLHAARLEKPCHRRLSGFRSKPVEPRDLYQVQVLVRDNNVDQALKALKKKMQREGIFREMKLRGHYEKPSEKKARQKAEAVRRARKLARKKLQREGLLPMKPRVIPGAPGRSGPARAPRF